MAEDATPAPEPTEAGVLVLGELDVPAQIMAGEQINVTVPVPNPTGSEVTENVTLRGGGNVVETREVTLAANETRNVTVQVNVSEDKNDILLTAATDADAETGLFEVEGVAGTAGQNETATPTATPEPTVTPEPAETATPNATSQWRPAGANRRSNAVRPRRIDARGGPDVRTDRRQIRLRRPGRSPDRRRR